MQNDFDQQLGQWFLFALLDEKEQIEQFTNLASKHVQEWIEGGHDVKENIPKLIHMSLPEKASHSTKRARGPNLNEERDNEGRQSNDGTPEDNDKENRKRKPRGETNNSKAKKVKKTSQNKTATKSSNGVLKPPNPKTAEYQASVSAVKEIYNSFATAGFPPSVPAQPPPTSMKTTSSVQPPVNVHLCSPNSFTNPMNTPRTIQQRNVEHRGSPSAGLPPSVQSRASVPRSSPTPTTSSTVIPTIQQQNGGYQTTPSAAFPSSVLAQAPPQGVHPILSSVQTQANVQLSSPAPVTTPMSIPCTSQQQNVEHRTTLSETAEIFGRAVACNLHSTDSCDQYPAGGFSDLLQRDELTDLREENRRLQEENKMLRCKLKNQPGKKKKLFISLTIT